jgi:hypothetical protein
MSSQRFSNIFRESLWLVHGRKCFHCGTELSLMEMKVDHLLPETLLNESLALLGLKKRLGLDDKFDLLGHENLIPACYICNSRKSDLYLADGLLGIHLATIKTRLPALQESLETRRKETDLDSIFRLVARSVDAKKFSASEIIDRIKRLEELADIAPEDDTAAPGEIIWTQHALERARERQIAVRDVLNALRGADPVDFKAGWRNDIYSIEVASRGGRLLRIAFSISRGCIFVLTVEWS